MAEDDRRLISSIYTEAAPVGDYVVRLDLSLFDPDGGLGGRYEYAINLVEAGLRLAERPA